MTPLPNHVIGSIRKIDTCCWLIGGRLMLCRQSSPSPSYPTWTDEEGGFFVLLDAPNPVPESKVSPEDTLDFQPKGHHSESLPQSVGLVYTAGSGAAVWRAGSAFIKIHYLSGDFEEQPLSFDVPNVLYHGEWDNRYYIVLTRVPGQTLAEAWPTIGEAVRQYYVGRVAEICMTMAEWIGDAISGVDGKELGDAILAKNDKLESFAPQRMLEHCTRMGMDTSKLVFYHSDLGPGNILVDPATRTLSIIDWETAGYVPKEWVRTKFHLFSGMDFPNGAEGSRSDWRRLVGHRLADLGFPEVIDGWLESGRMV
ncbi:kinase-like domain-containing protein [Xylaria palmicola]|nr:kinase-like domain-containing protein [Xylaria palmicola]